MAWWQCNSEERGNLKNDLRKRTGSRRVEGFRRVKVAGPQVLEVEKKLLFRERELS